jgi:hypothetical protein
MIILYGKNTVICSHAARRLNTNPLSERATSGFRAGTGVVGQARVGPSGDDGQAP